MIPYAKPLGPRVTKVTPNDDFNLSLEFDDGQHKLFDMSPYLEKGLFTRLKNLATFKGAYVSFGTVMWSCGLDIAPETLYLEGSGDFQR